MSILKNEATSPDLQSPICQRGHRVFRYDAPPLPLTTWALQGKPVGVTGDELELLSIGVTNPKPPELFVWLGFLKIRKCGSSQGPFQQWISFSLPHSVEELI